MTRFATAVFVMLACATVALGQDARSYANARFGYTLAVPAQFELVRDSDNGDGQSYRDGATRLVVWGGNIIEGDFETEAHAAIDLAADGGWGISYEAVTPSWASFSAAQGQRLLYQRMIGTCDGQYAAFRLEYSAVDLAEIDPVVDQLVRSLKGDC